MRHHDHLHLTLALALRHHDHLHLNLALAMHHHDHLYCGGLMPALPAGCAAVCTAGWGAAVPGPRGPLAAIAASRGSLGSSGTWAAAVPGSANRRGMPSQPCGAACGSAFPARLPAPAKLWLGSWRGSAGKAPGLGPLGVGAADGAGQREWAGGGGKDDEDRI